MNVVLYGATGMIGSRILNELIARGHKVTVVARNPAKVSASSQLPGTLLQAGSRRCRGSRAGGRAWSG